MLEISVNVNTTKVLLGIVPDKDVSKCLVPKVNQILVFAKICRPKHKSKLGYYRIFKDN